MPSNKSSKRKLSTYINIIKSHLTLNIGMVLFGALLFYMLVSLILYLTSSHFTTYQVTSAPLSRNETYTALAVRTEKVVSADVGGYINYYAREGSKINASGIVYGISADPTQVSDSTLSSEDLSRVRRQMSAFSYGFNSANFNSTYSFKSELEGNILQYVGIPETVPSVNSDSGDSDSDSGEEVGNEETALSVNTANQTLSRTDQDGIILYSKDGYENVTADNISKENFDQNSYHTEDLKTREAVNPGDDIYTIITNERWSLYIPLSAKQATLLSDRTSIKVRFLKDDLSQNGDFSIVTIEGDSYGKIDLSNGLIRYVSDRFLDIELVTNTQSGLKLPLSAIVSKEFYVIPKEYQTRGGNDQDIGFLLEQSEEGNTTAEFVSTSVYAENEDMYYVEKSAFEEGTLLVKPDSSDRYVIHDTGSLEGVYCINEGYARFRRISIIDQNEEYCIVERNTSYGLSQYDQIVFDAEDVNEEDILF